MNYIYAAASAVIFIFIFFILNKSKKNTADYLLVGLNFLLFLFLFADAWVNYSLTSYSLIFQNTLPFFIFAVFLFYCLQFLFDSQKKSKLWNLIFLPGIGFLVYSIADHFILNSYSLEEVKAQFTSPPLIYHLFFKGSQIGFLIILGWLIKKIHQFEIQIQQGYSYIETISIDWLKNFAYIYFGSIFITFVMFLSHNLGLIPYNINWVFGVVNGLLVISVFYVNFNGIKHYTISQEFNNPTPVGEVEEHEPETTTKGLKNLGSKKSEEVQLGIKNLFEEEQIYLQPKLGLKDVADKLEVSPHAVSEILNTIERKSFYDFVNEYRVNHLKKALTNPKNQNFTILALGFDSGFNSKASMNRIFKNLTGVSPNQYQKIESQSIG